MHGDFQVVYSHVTFGHNFDTTFRRQDDSVLLVGKKEPLYIEQTHDPTTAIAASVIVMLVQT